MTERIETAPGRWEIKSRDWLIVVEDDQAQGFAWTATRLGTLWAKGWTRTRSARKAELHARAASSAAYSDHVLDPLGVQ